MHKYCELESLNLTAVWGKNLTVSGDFMQYAICLPQKN